MAILKDVVPDLKKIGVLVSPGKPDYSRTSEWARRVAGRCSFAWCAADIVEADETNLIVFFLG